MLTCAHMKPAALIRLPLLATVALFLSLSGCTWINQMGAPSTEEALAAAGFRARPADTPQKMQLLEQLPPYKLVPQSFRGRELYVYADPAKDILYVGGPAEYQQFNQTLVEQNAANETLMAAQENEAAAEMNNFDWNDMWGPFWW